MQRRNPRAYSHARQGEVALFLRNSRSLRHGDRHARAEGRAG